MKLSELTSCVVCGGPIGRLFYCVTAEQIMLDATATNRVLGLNTMFGGALGLAEVFAPNDSVTMSLQQESGLVCQECFYDSELARRILFREGQAADTEAQAQTD